MKSLFKIAIVVSVLAFFVPEVSIKLQAQTDNAPLCMMKAVRDFKIVVAPGATIEVQSGEEFLGKMYPNMARIKIGEVWYEVSRNDVMLSYWVHP
jgi:hypothetical protein